MNCKEVKKLFALFLENEISQDQRAEIEKHLKTCPKCSQLLDEFSQLWTSLDQREKVQASPNFWIKLQQRIINSKERKSPVMDLVDMLIRFALPAAAALMAAIFVGNYLGNFSMPDGQTLSSELQYLTVFNDMPAGSIEEIYFKINLEE